MQVGLVLKRKEIDYSSLSVCLTLSFGGKPFWCICVVNLLVIVDYFLFFVVQIICCRCRLPSKVPRRNKSLYKALVKVRVDGAVQGPLQIFNNYPAKSREISPDT